MTDAKYICKECKKGFSWLEDFLNHIKTDHPGKKPLKYANIWRGKSLVELKKTLLKE